MRMVIGAFMGQENCIVFIYLILYIRVWAPLVRDMPGSGTESKCAPSASSTSPLQSFPVKLPGSGGSPSWSTYQVSSWLGGIRGSCPIIQVPVQIPMNRLSSYFEALSTGSPHFIIDTVLTRRQAQVYPGNIRRGLSVHTVLHPVGRWPLYWDQGGLCQGIQATCRQEI